MTDAERIATLLEALREIAGIARRTIEAATSGTPETQSSAMVEANAALVEAESLIAALRSAGAGSFSVGAVKDALVDAFRDIQGGINRTLDNEGLEFDDYRLDLSELEDA